METYNPEDLFKAIKDNDLEKVKSIVEKYSEVIDINKLDDEYEDESAFELAYIYENYDIAKFLIDKFKDSININRMDREEYTIFERRICCITDIKDEDKQTYSIKFLIENFKDSFDIKQVNNALIRLCSMEKIRFDIVKSIVENFKDSIDINKTDEEGNTALMHCLYEAQDEVSKFLVSNFKDSIDINQVNHEGYSTFLCRFKDICHDIGEYNNNFYLKFIIDNFSEVININQTDKEGNTALMLACIQGYPKLVEYLIEKFNKNIDINHTNKDGNNALMLASNFKYSSDEEKYFEVIKIVTENFDKVIDINQTNKKGKTVLDIANKNEHEDIIEFLTNKFKHNIIIDKDNIDEDSIIPTALSEHVKSEEYKKKEFESIDTIFVKIGDVVHCYTKNNTVKRDTKDKKQLLLNVDTGAGRYMKTDDEGVDVYRYHNRTDTILYS